MLAVEVLKHLKNEKATQQLLLHGRIPYTHSPTHSIRAITAERFAQEMYPKYCKFLRKEILCLH